MTKKKLSKKSREVLIRSMAESKYGSEGYIEVDDNAVISEPKFEKGESGGAYVQAWVWVDFADTLLDKS